MRMNDKLLEEIKKRLDCLILLECKKELSEKEKLKIASKCMGLTNTANLLGKDKSNFSNYLNDKWGKKKDVKKDW